MKNICVFGDSIAWGAWDKKGGWTNRLKIDLEEKDILVYNLGISGDTTEELLERFEFETNQRLDEEEETIFIFEIGINDSQFIHSQKSMRHPSQEFQKNLQKLINLAQKFSSKIIFLGLTPVDDSRVDPMPWDTDKSYKSETVKKFNNIIKSVCSENKVYFIEIFKNFIKTDYKKLLEDGAHPNSKGHEIIFMIVKEFLIKNKVI